MISNTIKIFFCLFIFSAVANAQPYFPAKGKVYNDSIVARVDILIDPDSLLAIMNNVFSNQEYHATFIFNDGITIDTVNNIGFRLRGNTSRTSAKKSFKVSFNTFIKGQKYNGLEKLNLNGEHNDPSIIRTKLFWESAANALIPASRANHVELYINGAYRGLYINVEHIDENFLEARYLNNYGNLYKCLWPADLAYLGSFADDYKIMQGSRRVYDLKTNTGTDDYTDLKDFIATLHASASPQYQLNLENQFNVNAFLRCYAMDVVTGNWDNYAGNMNNYYLYHNPQTNKMDYIVYDVDNSYGIDWLNKDWGTRDCYNWQVDPANRPLITKLMAYQDYRDRFSFFMNKIMQSFSAPAKMIAYADTIKNKIAPYVVNDTYHSMDYGYTYASFLNSYTQALGGHVPYGLYDYINVRNTNSNAQLLLNNVAPVFSETRHIPYTPYTGDTVFIKSWVEDEDSVANVYMHYKINFNGVLDSMLMMDDGLHEEDLAGDNIFGAVILPQTAGDTIYYFLTNADAQNNTGREPRSGFLAIPIQNAPQLFVNEWMADNVNAVADNFGEYDDFFEIYNAANDMDMHRIFVTDDFTDLNKWNVGDKILQANKFMLCWADNQKEQGDNHASFKLSASGEMLAITEYTGKGYRIIDSLTFGAMTANQSAGCYPDGVKPLINLQNVTAGFSNVPVAFNNILDASGIKVFPNPTADNIFFITNLPDGIYRGIIADVMGNTITKIDVLATGKPITINTEKLAPGIYMLHLIGNTRSQSCKFVKL